VAHPTRIATTPTFLTEDRHWRFRTECPSAAATRELAEASSVCGMEPSPPRPSLIMGALTVAVALSACAIAAAVMVPTMLGGVGAWPVLVAGCVLLTIALGGLWRIQKRRD
jgi:hypothetical protein